MANRSTKTAIIGVGPWGRNVARELAAVSQLAGYASAGSEFLKPLSRLSIDDILGDASIKAVAIVTPISQLAHFARLALEANKHVFVEKPLARLAAEARLVAEAARERRLVLATGYQFLYNPVYEELKRRIDRASIRRVTLDWRKFGTFSDTIEHMLLTHHLALALDLLGEPLRGTVRLGGASKTPCDKIETTLFYKHGEVHSSIDRHSSQRLHIIQVELTNGCTFTLEENRLMVRKTKDHTPEMLYHSEATSLRLELMRFQRAVSGDQISLPTGGQFAADVLSLCEALAVMR